MKTKPNYTSKQKAQTVLDLLRGDKTLDEVCIKNGVSKTSVHYWKKKFDENVHLLFEIDTKSRKESKPKKEDSPDYLKGIIGKQVVELEILKKALGVWG